MRIYNHYYLSGVLCLLITVTVLMFVTRIYSAFIPGVLTAVSLYTGFTKREIIMTHDMDRDRISSTAIYFPGYVNIFKNGRPIVGWTMNILFYVSIVILLLAILGIINSEVIDRSIALPLMLGAILSIVGIILLSITDATEYCDRLDLPKVGGNFEWPIHNCRVMRTVTILSVVILFVAGMLFL